MNREYCSPSAEFSRQCPGDISPETIRLLGEYLHILLEENRIHNLTAIREVDEAWNRHILEVIHLNQHIAASGSIIDIGSGGGIPGIPLAILRPETAVSLLETTGKKADFLGRVKEKLHLSHVEIINMRAEDAAHTPQYREHFDMAVCRAVGSLAEIVELCTPFLTTNGRFYAVKGIKAREESEQANRAIGELCCEIEQIAPLRAESTENRSSLVTIRKTHPTPQKYPRRAGTPKRKPL